MGLPIVYGPAFSSYVRTVRMTLAEKGVEYTLEAVDRDTDEYRAARNPFGKVPAFEHDGVRLYETAAITRYVDEAFDGPSLQPGGALEHARQQQAIGLADAYLYPAAVRGILIPRILVPMRGGQTDEAAVAGAVPGTATALTALDAILGDSDYLSGDDLSLADLHVLPMLEGLTIVPERDAVFAGAPRLGGWVRRMASRPSAIETRPQI